MYKEYSVFPGQVWEITPEVSIMIFNLRCDRGH